MLSSFYSHGKLLLTGEYFVLDGAKSLAVPTKLGQHLRVQNFDLKQKLQWRSWDEKQKLWFEATFDSLSLVCLEASDDVVAQRLEEILKVAKALNPSFLRVKESWHCDTFLEFPRTWGLGTSSTLIANVANWAQIDPYILLEKTFGGSGYDLACAKADSPIIYQNKTFETTTFEPTFIDQLYFVYLGKKQNSREGIARYRANTKANASLIDEISDLTFAIKNAQTLEEFDFLLEKHENIVAKSLDLPRAKALYFKDFWGEIKSLGAWGGDFVLATSNRSPKETQDYFKIKKLDFFRYKDLV